MLSHFRGGHGTFPFRTRGGEHVFAQLPVKNFYLMTAYIVVYNMSSMLYKTQSEVFALYAVFKSYPHIKGCFCHMFVTK